MHLLIDSVYFSLWA